MGRVVFDGRYDQPRGFTSFKRHYHFSRDHLYYLTSSSFVAHNLQVVRMITTSKDGFCDKSDAEILNSLKDCLPDVDFKREALKD